MKKLFRAISILMLVCLVFPMTAFAAQPQDTNAMNARLARIELLNQERDDLYMKVLADPELRSNAEINAQLEENKQELMSQGVRFLTWAEVIAEYPDMKEYAEQLGESNNLNTRVDSVVNEITETTNIYTINNVQYEFNKLYFSPKESSSCLYDSKSSSKSYNANWIAGNYKLWDILASCTNYDEPNSNITRSYSLYSALHSSVSEIQQNTEIFVGSIQCSYVNRVTACFTYIKRSENTSETPILSTVSTKTRTSMSYNITNLRYKNEFSSWITPNNAAASGSYSANITPIYYDNIVIAVRSYEQLRNEIFETTYWTSGVSSISIAGPVEDVVSNPLVRFSPIMPLIVDVTLQ